MINILNNGKTDNYVYDISLDGTVVNALGMNVAHNTDGFNFQMPEKWQFRYTEKNPYIGKGLNRLVEKGKEYTYEEADLMEFNDKFMRGKMGLDIDEMIPANITVSRKNYLDLLDNGKIKIVGNTLKSKKMPIYIEKFMNHGAELLLNGKGKEFLEYYYDYIEKIYNMKISLKEIASVGKIKTSISEYKENCKTLTKGGTKRARQAWYELAIKHNLSVNMGDSIYYINNGTKKNDSDVKRVTKYFYMNEKGERVDYALDENGEKMYDRKGNIIDLTKQLTKDYNKLKKKEEGFDTKYPKLIDYAKSIYPNIQEDDIVIFNCVLLENKLIEDEEEHFCDDTFEYNREKYIDMFNKRIRPLLVVFDKSLRTTIDEKGKEVDNILIANPKDRKTFTEEEAKLISGQPFQEGDQDTYEQLMTMEDKEIKFWIERNKRPTYIDDCIDMNWEDIVEDYKQREKDLQKEEIKSELEKYNKIIDKIKPSQIDAFIEDGVLPTGLQSFIEMDYKTGVLKSKKHGVKLGTIYDIIEKDFSEDDDEDDDSPDENE